MCVLKAFVDVLVWVVTNALSRVPGHRFRSAHMHTDPSRVQRKGAVLPGPAHRPWVLSCRGERCVSYVRLRMCLDMQQELHLPFLLRRGQGR